MINNAIHDLLRASSDRNYTADRLAAEEQKFFKDIQFYQRFGAAEINLIDTKLPEQTLHNLSFDNLRLIRSTITGLDMSHDKDDATYLSPYVFNDSSIANSNFSGANLAFSQFRDTLLTDTNFKDANLYRASFDGAQLCRVDFKGASLLQASFWNSTFDPATRRSLRNGAWWLAKGWTPAQINELAGRDARSAGEPDTDDVGASVGARAGARRLSRRPEQDARNLPGHPRGAQRPRRGERRARRFRPRARSQPLGVDAHDQRAQPDAGRLAERASGRFQLRRAEPIPKTALCAANQASQALSLASRSSGGANPSAEDYRTFRASIEDTLGYVHLQKGDAEAALPRLTEGAGEKRRNDRDALFRLSVAEYTLGKKEWIEDMQRSIDYRLCPDPRAGAPLRRDRNEIRPEEAVGLPDVP